MRAMYATHVGVEVPRRKDQYTCNRCGMVKTVNNTRRNKDGEQVVLDRRTYLCTDCRHVEAAIRREESP